MSAILGIASCIARGQLFDRKNSWKNCVMCEAIPLVFSRVEELQESNEHWYRCLASQQRSHGIAQAIATSSRPRIEALTVARAVARTCEQAFEQLFDRRRPRGA
jgi:hypothetical protein